MSAWLVSETHIRALVSAMEIARRGMSRFPYPPPALLSRHPEAFGGLIRAREEGEEFPPFGLEDQTGRALWLANLMALRAHYTKPEQVAEHDENEAEVMAYRHALVELPPASLIKQAKCWAHQCAEDNEAVREWARAVADELQEWAIGRLPGYSEAPWGLSDPPGGAPAPGTTGAPVSILSMLKRS